MYVELLSTMGKTEHTKWKVTTMCNHVMQEEAKQLNFIGSRVSCVLFSMCCIVLPAGCAVTACE